MPLFALSGTIVSAGFLFLLNLVALNFVWNHFHPIPVQMDEKIIAAEISSHAGSSFSDKQNYRLTADDLSQKQTRSLKETNTIVFANEYGRLEERLCSFSPSPLFSLTYRNYIPSLSLIPLKSFSFRGPPVW